MTMSGCAPKTPIALAAPSRNRGVGFTPEERRKLGLTGRLPSGVLIVDEQAERVWRQLQHMPTNLARNLLDQLHYRHEGSARRSSFAPTWIARISTEQIRQTEEG